MKKLYAIVLGLIISYTTIQAQNNSLIIYSNEGVQFTVIMNGVRQNMEPQTNVKITGLNSQNYKVKLIFANNKPDLDKTIWLTNGAESTSYTDYTYGLDIVKGVYKLRFKSAAPSSSAPVAQQNVVVYNVTPAPAPVQQQTSTVTTTAPTSVTTTTNVTETTVSSTSGNSANVGVNMGGVGININVPATGTTVTQNVTTTSTTTSSSVTSNQVGTTTNVNTGNTYVLPGYTGTYGCPSPMTQSNFENAKKSIASKNFDESRITIAKQIIGNNCLLCSQIKDIMSLMSFEASKLEIAKYAWHHTLDKGNFYTLNDAFTFEASIEELDNYTKTH